MSKEVLKRLAGGAGLILIIIGITFFANNSNGSVFTKNYVKSYLDASYYNELDEYEEITRLSTSTDESPYQINLDMQYDYLTTLYNLEDVTDAHKEKIYNIFKDVNSKVKYTVHEGIENKKDEDYTVKVDIEPVDVFIEIDKEIVQAYNDLTSQYDVENITAEEYAQFNQKWNETVINLFETKTSSMAYLPAKTVDVHVYIDSATNLYMIDSDSVEDLDLTLIDYNIELSE